MYQRVGKEAYKVDLSNTQLLDTYLKHPHHNFKTIHVGGTNGKGSTSHMLASVLQEAGYNVGLYTSPHLKDFRERIKINGEMIPKRAVSSFVSKHQDFFIKNQLSFFEMTVGLAFDFFSSQKVDIAIIEVGLGGRLDSTNIITPLVSVITNIGLDHTQFLGTTLEQITTEKAGIIKKGIPVIIGETVPVTRNVFLNTSEILKSPILFSKEQDVSLYPCDLKGSYQEHNQRTVLVVLEQLNRLDFKISEENITEGLANVVKNTGLLGRWQILQENPKVICDTAHNKEGLQYTMAQLRRLTYNALHIVLGVVSDKDLETVLPLFPKQATYYFCQPQIARRLDVDVLATTAANFNLEGESFFTVEDAYKKALQNAAKDDVIYIGGSTFVVAEVV